jgi:hypothetical protein
MDFRIRVEADLGGWQQEWDERLRKQVPFATALALTMTAKDAQTDVRGALGDSFTIRSKYVERGIRIKAATKRDLTAEIGSRADFMRAQAEGGIKEPRGGRAGIAIPLDGARPTPTTMTPRSKWPGALMRRKKDRHWVMDIKGRPTLVRAVGEGDGARIEPVYLIASRVRVPERWPLEEQVTAVISAKWAVNGVKALKRAMATRKGRRR